MTPRLLVATLAVLFATGVGAASVAGCASGPAKVKAEEAFRSRPIEPAASLDGGIGQAADSNANENELLTPEQFARKFKAASSCEMEARFVKQTAPDKAWAFLRACLQRGAFKDLDLLVENWGRELRTRPEGVSALASVIAARGGYLLHDLDVLQQRQFQLLDLAAATEQPRTSKGKAVLFLGRIRSIARIKGQAELTVMELATIGDRSATASTITFRRDDGTEESQAHFQEAGRNLTVRLAAPDPALTPGRELLFLGRFESVRELSASDELGAGEEPKQGAVLTLISHHEVRAR
jgi:hypothetical protein